MSGESTGGMKIHGFSRPFLRRAGTAVFLAAVYAVIFVKLDVRLLFTDTILTGGDSCSWLQPMLHLKEYLIPHFRLFGWTLANFFGYAEFQHYFILPFLTGVAYSLVLPVNVALKLATMTGIFLLPIAFYVSVVKISGKRVAALTASALSLVFIFNESYTMFGGNLLSTLAGEFSYSFAVFLFVLYVAFVWDSLVKGRSPVLPGILLALIGLSHSFVFMVAFLVPVFFLIGRNAPPRRTLNLLLIYAVGLLLQSFWLVPMVLTRRFATPIAMSWAFSSLKDFFLQTFFILIAYGVLSAVSLALLSARGRKKALFVFYLYGACAFFFVVSQLLEIPDIRFIPPALLVSVFSISFLAGDLCGFLAYYLRKNKRIRPGLLVPLVPGAFFVVSTVFVMTMAPNAAAWFSWNNTGYEAKKEYANLMSLSSFLKGDFRLGRIMWEKQNQHDNADFGSERGFENLFMFTGRGTTEGIHYGSSASARMVSYMQSEYSLRPTGPEAHRVYSEVNPDAWPFRFYGTNSRDIIVFSDDMKRLFLENQYFTLSGTFGKFQVFSFDLFPSSFVEPRDPDDVVILEESAGGASADFYRWFREYELSGTVFVPLRDASDLEGRFPRYESYEAMSAARERDPDFMNFHSRVSPLQSAVSNEYLEPFVIRFDTEAVGKPHIVKVSYAPNFRSKNGEKIYPVSPGFMMMIPESSRVEIRYGATGGEIAGIVLTLLSVPLLVSGKRLRLSGPVAKILSFSVLGIASCTAVLLLVLTFAAGTRLERDLSDAGKAYRVGKNLDRAERLIDRYVDADTFDRLDNSYVIELASLKATILSDRGRTEEALSLLDSTIGRFPHARLVADTKRLAETLRKRIASRSDGARGGPVPVPVP